MIDKLEVETESSQAVSVAQIADKIDRFVYNLDKITHYTRLKGRLD